MFKEMQASLAVMADDYQSMEYSLKATPTFLFNLNDNSYISVKAGLNYLKGHFDKNFMQTKSIDYGWMGIDIQPTFILNQDIFSLKLGGTVAFISGKEKSYTKFYPNVNASVKLMDDFVILYAGAEGNTAFNSYQQFTEENPYVSPTLDILPTFNNYKAFGGIKGNLDSSIHYSIQGFYANASQSPIYMGNVMDIVPPTQEYQYYNSFSVEYIDTDFMGLKAEIEGTIAQEFFFSSGISYQSFQPKDENGQIKVVPYTPQLLLNINTDYKLMKSLFVGADIFYVGQRKAYDYSNGIIGVQSELKTLKPYFDLNLHADYTLNNHWTLSAKVQNLLCQPYNYWLYYPTQGLQITGGIKYQFKN